MELTQPDQDRLARVLGGPDTRRLVSRVRERMARGLPLTATISLANPTVGERAAVDQLLGRRASGGASVSVPLSKVDAVLRDSGIHPEGLAAAVVTLAGPVVNRADAEAEVDRAWTEALDPMWRYVENRPELREWWADAVRAGMIRRAARDTDHAARLARHLTAVLSLLPADRVLLGHIAVHAAGSAHALDPGEPLATVVLGAARVLGGVPDGANRRTAWASVGVIVDELSSTVLTLGLPGDSTTATGRALLACRSAGQPLVLTLRQLLRDPPTMVSDDVISVCENPSVLAAAADRHGTRCLPLVCVSGQPSAAALRLLEEASAAGAPLRYHGDFDWYGVAIANFLRRRFDWSPWRFREADYTSAIGSTLARPLSGKPIRASWDPALADAMTAHGFQLEEEAVTEHLLADLSGPATVSGNLLGTSR